MKQYLFASILSVIISLSPLSLAGSEDIASPADTTCDVPGAGPMTCTDFFFKGSLTHYWQGAAGGVRTNNADRITGLYDLDMCYLVAADRCEDNQGDYFLLGLSSQMAFGNGISNSKVDSFFKINDGTKGYHDIYVDKAYAEFTAMDRLMTFNVGKIDMKDFFDNNAVANKYRDQFFAAPLVQSGNVPFPSNSLGVRAKCSPSDFWYIQAAVADGNANKREMGFRTGFDGESDMVVMAEVGFRPKLYDKQGNYRFMLWYEDQNADYLDGSGRTKSNDLGYSMSFDQDLTERFTAFLRYGWANDKVNKVEDFFSFGGQIKEPIKGRKDDVFAVGYANGLRSPYGLNSQDKRQINLFETYYSIKVNKNMKISPNLQLIMNPGGLKSESPATVLGLRCRIKF